jgi:hypothetical protein
MNDLLVDRTTKRVRLVRSKLKLIVAHLWLAARGPQSDGALSLLLESRESVVSPYETKRFAWGALSL